MGFGLPLWPPLCLGRVGLGASLPAGRGGAHGMWLGQDGSGSGSCARGVSAVCSTTKQDNYGKDL